MSITHINNMPLNELNNNDDNNVNNNNNNDLYKRTYKRSSLTSISSASSSHSDSSEENDGNAKITLPESTTTKDIDKEKADFRRYRSMSDGSTSLLANQEPFEVFPSLPDSVLEKMGLVGNGPRERLNEEELEQKFVSLALAFTIDAATIKDRCERQRRYRDQTETNLSVELEKLIQKANRIQPLCVDAETTELLSALLSQIDIVTNASALATISAERYGAVQHEERISESVNVMINHVNLLKQQRDSARRQLQYTKRVLQNTNTAESPPVTKQIPITNGRIITRRRASIATITQPNDSLRLSDPRKITRRISDLTLRATAVARTSRPSRLELGLDLVKIKENMVESESCPQETSNQSDLESNQEDISSPEEVSPNNDELPHITPVKYRLMRHFRRFRKKVEDTYNQWSEEGTIHRICNFCSLLCFTIGIIILANLLIEIEFSRRSMGQNRNYWHSTHETSSRKVYKGGT